ncbi:MAG: YajQ family cyclic di-GMP-binding protein [Bacteriovoracaceae bacterium]|jgi:cyclic-di-GMP-binding protein|nr:YajQ family cyclic di-GMP-binding protein [Bacteriovoracaceae bacterium]
MPSFDLVSKLDMGEIKNALIQAQKELSSRYDFKGSKVAIELKGDTALELTAEDEYKMRAALEIFRAKLIKRNLGMKNIEPGDITPAGNQMLKQTIVLKNGIDKEQGKKINKIIKEGKFKVTSSYLEERVRITGKKIDDLQMIFSMLKSHKDVEVELQMENMKS